MKVLFVQHQNFINGSGGTEKICSLLANHFAGIGHSVAIATNENITGKPVFHLKDTIVVTNIYSKQIKQEKIRRYKDYKDKSPVLKNILQLKNIYKRLRNQRVLSKIGGEDEVYTHNLLQRSKAWKQYISTFNPDVIITMSIGSLLEITYQQDYTVPIINSTNGRPDYDYTDLLWYRSTIDKHHLKESYKKLSGIQILFDSYKNYLPDTFKGTYQVIPNPVPQFQDKDTIDYHDKKRYKIINIASLVIDCKQQNLAIDIFAELKDEFHQWDLHFWGVGGDYEILAEQIKQKNLTERVFLNGFTDTPLKVLQDADIFLFPSEYEGFPLALTEAMSAGLPVIGFSHCSGVNELIKDHVNGFLAKDRTDMRDKLKLLMQDSSMRTQYGTQAHRDMRCYTFDHFYQQWESFINSFTE